VGHRSLCSRTIVKNEGMNHGLFSMVQPCMNSPSAGVFNLLKFALSHEEEEEEEELVVVVWLNQGRSMINSHLFTYMP